MMTFQKYTKYVDAKTIGIFLLCLVTLTSITLAHIDKGILPGDASYNIARYSASWLSTGKPYFYDSLSYYGRVVSLQQGTPATIALFSKLSSLSIEMLSFILPIVLGLFSLALFYLIIAILLENRKLAQLSTLLTIFSPPFLYTFSTSNYHMLPVFFTLLSIFFLLCNKKVLAIMSFTLIPFFGTLYSVIALSLVLIHALVRKNRSVIFLAIFLINIALIILLNIQTISVYGLPEIVNFKANAGLNFAFQNFIAEFGGSFGLSIFSIILSFYGLASLWKKKFQYMHVYLAVIFLLALSMFVTWPIIYLNFILTMIAALGLINIYSLKWESRLIKNSTIFILLTGLIFTAFSHTLLLYNLQPNQDIIDSLQVLNAESNPGDVILSHYSNGYWIESISSRPAFMDSSLVYAPSVNKRYGDAKELFSSRSIDAASLLLIKYDIKYIWITKDMKTGLVWNNDEDGLLFLLKYNTKFKKIFSNDYTEIWQVRSD